MAGEQLSG